MATQLVQVGFLNLPFSAIFKTLTNVTRFPGARKLYLSVFLKARKLISTELVLIEELSTTLQNRGIIEHSKLQAMLRKQNTIQIKQLGVVM